MPVDGVQSAKSARDYPKIVPTLQIFYRSVLVQSIIGILLLFVVDLFCLTLETRFLIS